MGAAFRWRFLDPRKIQDILVPATKALATIGGFGASVYAGITWLSPKLADIVGPAVATPLTFAVSISAASLVLWGAYRALSKKSKLLRVERFDLRVRSASELLGREKDVENLKGLIDGSNLILVDGESGCGKSSLIAYGLVPKHKEDGPMFPVLVSSYGGDWDTGLAGKIFEAIWSGLTKEEREKIGFTERPPVGSVDADSVRRALERVVATFGLLADRHSRSI